MGCEWIGWCALSGSEQAAWVQAFGSIAALAVPIFLYVKDRLDRNATAARAAATFLIVLRPALRRFQGKISTFIRQIGPNEEGEVLDMSNLPADYESEVPALFDLLRQAPQLPGLDAELTALAHEIEDLEADTEAINTMMRGGLHSAWINNVDEIVEKATLAERRAARILEKISPKPSTDFN